MYNGKRLSHVGGRGGVEVVHGVPLLVSGMPNSRLLALKDFYTWLGHMVTRGDIYNPHTMFTNTYTNTNTTALAESSGLPSAAATAGSSSTPVMKTASPSTAVVYNLYMPADIEKKASAVFEMRHVVPSTVGTMNIKSSNIVSELIEKYIT
jgi:hypothetical protein